MDKGDDDLSGEHELQLLLLSESELVNGISRTHLGDGSSMDDESLFSVSVFSLLPLIFFFFFFSISSTAMAFVVWDSL